MESDILISPIPKKRGYFHEHHYPFPIFINNDVQSSTSNNADNGSISVDNSKPKWKVIIGHLQLDSVLITDKESMKMVYKMGFFGKGTLSRGAPRICAPPRVFKGNDCKDSLLKGDNGNNEDSSSEEDEPNIRKLDTNEDIKPKRRKLDTNEDVKPAINVTHCESSSSSSSSASSSSSSDDEQTSMKEPPEENLQLTFEEAYFLSYALGCFVVMDKTQPLDLLRLWQKLCELTIDQNFPVTYTAYHHFRSKGWIVRSGLKYGADFVLYRDGPPFYHSSYVVIVKPVKEKHLKDINQNGRMQLTWASLAAVKRVNSQVSKDVLLLYVIKPEMMSEYKVSTPFCISQFKLQEVLVKRWVASTGREGDS